MRFLFLIFSVFTPFLVLAQPDSFADVVETIIDIIALAFPAVLALTLLVFFWGLVRLLASGGDENAVEQGKKLMFWGIVGLFVMISTWAIVGLLTGSFFDNVGPFLPHSPEF